MQKEGILFVKLSTSYAVSIMIFMAKNPFCVFTSSEISKKTTIEEVTVCHILKKLLEKKLLKRHKNSNSSNLECYLSDNPKKITIASIINILENQKAIIKNNKIFSYQLTINETIMRALNSVRLSDLTK